MDFELSKLHIYSYGTVAADKPLNTKKAMVHPEETFPMMDGEATSQTVQQTHQGRNQDGSAYTQTSIASSVIECEWLPFACGQRVTAPDVRRGERVAIYQFGNEQKYYWTTLGWDLKLRKLETVIYAWSGTTNESAEVDAENYYFFEVSTHQKLIHFHTSQANGEPFGWDIQLDTGKGVLTVTDTIGNHFLIDSAQHRIYSENASGTSVELLKNDLTMTVPGNTTINTQGNTTVNTQGSSVVKTNGSATVETTGVNHITGARNIMVGSLSLSPGSGGGTNKVTGTLEVDRIIVDQLQVNSIIEAPGINGPARGLF